MLNRSCSYSWRIWIRLDRERRNKECQWCVSREKLFKKLYLYIYLWIIFFLELGWAFFKGQFSENVSYHLPVLAADVTDRMKSTGVELKIHSSIGYKDLGGLSSHSPARSPAHPSTHPSRTSLGRFALWLFYLIFLKSKF